MKNTMTMTGGGGEEGSLTTPLTLREQRDSNWLDVDHSPENSVGFDDGAAEDEYQKMKNIEDNLVL